MKKAILKKLAMSVSALCLSASAFAVTTDIGDIGGGITNPPVVDNGGSAGGQIGPNPSESALTNSRGGPFKVTSVKARGARGFGGGTIHYPTGVNQKMGAIAVVPGFVSYESSIKWWGPRLASWGFVVITIDTNTTVDQPDSRARQLSAALDHIIADGTVGGMIDQSKLGVIGWSMGGGGALKLATDRKLKAIIPQAPWYASSRAFRDLSTPTLMIACGADTIAPVRQHAQPFYDAIPSSTPKVFAKVRGASHFCGNTTGGNTDYLGKYGVSWMKLHMDGDNRFESFVCGSGAGGERQLDEYKKEC